jgi:hypothetical protein
MNALTTDQNFRLSNAIDWIDTFADELFDYEDAESSDSIGNVDL